MADIGRSRSQIGENIGSCLVNSRPNLVEIGPILADSVSSLVGRTLCCLKPDWQIWAELGRSHTNFGRFRAKVAKVQSKLPRPDLAGFGRMSVLIERICAALVPERPPTNVAYSVCARARVEFGGVGVHSGDPDPAHSPFYGSGCRLACSGASPHTWPAFEPAVRRRARTSKTPAQRHMRRALMSSLPSRPPCRESLRSPANNKACCGRAANAAASSTASWSARDGTRVRRERGQGCRRGLIQRSP